MAQPHFTPRQIAAFLVAAEIGNFTATAQRLHLSSSAVSNLIAELETGLGFALFERTTRKVVLTSAGRQFLPAASALQRQIGRASAAAADIRDHAIEVVRVAAPMAVAALLLPPLIAGYARVRPRTVVRIIDSGVEGLSDRVATGEADLAMGPERAMPADVVSTALFATDWVAWLAPSHPLVDHATLRWADLAATDVYAAGRDHEHSVLPLLADGPDAPRLTTLHVVDNLSTALGLAAAGVGVTFSPDYVLPMARAMGLLLRPLTGPAITRQVCLYESARVSARSAPWLAFRSYLLEQMRSPPLAAADLGAAGG